MKSFAVVDRFEESVAKFAGCKHGIAVNTCTSALFLSILYVTKHTVHRGGPVTIPAHTFISVPMVVLQAGQEIVFDPEPWKGTYQLKPYPIIDGALRFRRWMYEGGLHCVSFHARKLLNIGEGGMILTDNDAAAEWLRKARYSGRGAPDYRIEDIDMLGYQLYMTPEKAARGLHLMDYVEEWPDQEMEYIDLRNVKLFKRLGYA